MWWLDLFLFYPTGCRVVGNILHLNRCPSSTRQKMFLIKHRISLILLGNVPDVMNKESISIPTSISFLKLSYEISSCSVDTDIINFCCKILTVSSQLDSTSLNCLVNCNIATVISNHRTTLQKMFLSHLHSYIRLFHVK